MTGGDATVVGAGAWGTALALILAERGRAVRLWSYEAEVADRINTARMNPYLTGVEIPDGVTATADLAAAVDGAGLVVSVSPSQVVRTVMADAGRHMRDDVTVVSASKGIELGTLLRMDEVLSEVLSHDQMARFSVLSGPSFANEVAARAPTAVVVASRSQAVAEEVQSAFQTPWFRPYTTTDVIGVELGGALKNVVALAAGMTAGLGYGHNTTAALITRGLAEMMRLGLAAGADAATFYGLAGIGDLVLTCTGGLSRNRTVGYRLGQGETLEQILGAMHAVAEGVKTTSAVCELARRYDVEMPIAEEVRAIVEDGRSPGDALRSLMLRDPKPETST